MYVCQDEFIQFWPQGWSIVVVEGGVGGGTGGGRGGGGERREDGQWLGGLGGASFTSDFYHGRLTRNSIRVCK